MATEKIIYELNSEPNINFSKAEIENYLSRNLPENVKVTFLSYENPSENDPLVTIDLEDMRDLECQTKEKVLLQDIVYKIVDSFFNIGIKNTVLVD